MEVLKDFQFHDRVPDEIVSRYTQIIPEELVYLWKEYGLGTFLRGYLKIINPALFQDLLNESYFRGEISIPIFATGMADIITWEENKYLQLVRFRRGNIHVISTRFKYFINDLLDEEYCTEHLDWTQYLEATQKNGELAYDECYGYVPLLGLGGNETVANLQKSKLIEHIAIITAFMGPVRL